MPDNPHMGHRQRMLDKLRRFGLEIFSDHEVLEMLLYFTIILGEPINGDTFLKQKNMMSMT